MEPPSISSRISQCLQNYGKISQLEKGNSLYVDAAKNLEIDRTDQTSYTGSLWAAAGKTVTNWTSDYSGISSKWSDVAKRIDVLNTELQEIMETFEKNPHRYRDDKQKLKALKSTLLSAEQGLENLSQLYESKAKGSWFGSTAAYKSEASLRFDQQKHVVDELRKRIEGLLENEEKEKEKEKDEDISEYAFAALHELKLTDNQETKGQLGESFFLLDETKRISRLEFNETSQLPFIVSFLKDKRTTISINDLLTFKTILEKELKAAQGNDSATIPEALEKINEELGQRTIALDDFEKEFTIALEVKDNPTIWRLLGDLDSRLISEPKISELLLNLPPNFYDESQSFLNSLELITSGNKIEVIQIEEIGDREIRGAAILLHHQLNKLLENYFFNDVEDDQTALRLADSLLAADLWLKQDSAEDLLIRHPHMQTTIAKAYHMISDHYKNSGDEDQFIECLKKIAAIPLLSSQPFGDMKQINQQARLGPYWLQVDGTEVRRREVRVQTKEMTVQDRANRQFLSLSWTLPRKEREEFSERLTILSSKNTLRSAGITVTRDEKAIYPEFDFSKKAFKGEWEKRKAVDVGNVLTLSDAKGRIKLQIGSDKERWNQYQKVILTLNPSVTTEELQQFLVAVGLPMALFESRPEDIQHENIARMAYAMHPREMAFYADPQMAVQYSTVYPEKSDLDKSKAENILGRAKQMRLKDVGNKRLESVDDQMVVDFWRNGGRAFGATIGHEGVTLNLFEVYERGGVYKKQKIEDTAMTLSHILKGGQLSTMERLERGIVGSGCCPDENVETGSANQVFVRPLTDNQFESGHDFGQYAIEGNIFLLFDASLAERMPYGYIKDRAGLRNPNHQSKKTIRMAQKELPEAGLTGELMKERKTLTEILHDQRVADLTLPTAEVMFEDTVGANYIYGAVASSEEDKMTIIRVLHGQGIDNIGGKPLEEAIFVGALSREMIKNPF